MGCVWFPVRHMHDIHNNIILQLTGAFLNPTEVINLSVGMLISIVRILLRKHYLAISISHVITALQIKNGSSQNKMVTTDVLYVQIMEPSWFNISVDKIPSSLI